MSMKFQLKGFSKCAGGDWIPNNLAGTQLELKEVMGTVKVVLTSNFTEVMDTSCKTKDVFLANHWTTSLEYIKNGDVKYEFEFMSLMEYRVCICHIKKLGISVLGENNLSVSLSSLDTSWWE